MPGDAGTIARRLADDIVILHPCRGIIDRKDAVHVHRSDGWGSSGRVRQAATYSTVDVTVSGDLAYERGAVRHLLTSKSGGAVEREEGVYLWIYARRDRIWQIVRIAGTFTPADESVEEGTEGKC